MSHAFAYNFNRNGSEQERCVGMAEIIQPDPFFREPGRFKDAFEIPAAQRRRFSL